MSSLARSLRISNIQIEVHWWRFTKTEHCYMGLEEPLAEPDGVVGRHKLLWLSGIELLEKTQLVRAGHSYNRTQLAWNTNDAAQKYTSFKAVMISAIEGIQCLYERAVVHSDPFRFPANGGSPALFVTDGRDDDPNTSS
jgi:hypothetical protein